jgi:HlyD family secretion protein
LFTIANDLRQMRVIADVDEADIGQVEDGQNVEFSVDAYPNDVFEGKVTQVRLEATVTSNVVTYEVVISAYNPDLKLKPGLTANVTIYTLERQGILTIPSKALRFVPDEDALKAMRLVVGEGDQQPPAGRKIVWQKTGNTLQPKAISTGVSSLNMTEVTEGLSEGEEIILELASPLVNTPAATGGGPFRMGPPPRGGGAGG